MILTQAAAANVWDFVVLVAGFDQSYDCKLSKKGKCRGFVGPTSLLPLPSGGSHVESNGRRLVAGKRGKAESHISIRFISAFEACRSMGSRTTVVSSPCATWAGKQPDRPTLNKKSEALGGHPNLSKVLPGCQHQRPQASHIPYPISHRSGQVGPRFIAIHAEWKQTASYCCPWQPQNPSLHHYSA